MCGGAHVYVCVSVRVWVSVRVCSFRLVCGRSVCLFVSRCYSLPQRCTWWKCVANAIAAFVAADTHTQRHTYFRHSHLAKWCSNKSYLHTRRHNLTLTGALLMTECILIQKQFANSRKMHVKLGTWWKAVMGIAKDPQTKSRTVTSAHAKLMTFNWKIPFKWWWNNEVERQTGWGNLKCRQSSKEKENIRVLWVVLKIEIERRNIFYTQHKE